jgi:glyoxylase I family protein
MDAQPDTQTSAKLLSEPPMRLHHHAFVVKNQEVNRHFLEDILGIPLVATWCERNFYPDVGREVEFCHTFYEIGDGGALAFFQFADEEAWKNRVAGDTGTLPGGQHIALKVSQKTFDELMHRAEAAGVAARTVDHGFCVSMYLISPDGLRLEFTVDPPDATEIAAMRRGDAHSELARWTAGDRKVNNHIRPS